MNVICFKTEIILVAGIISGERLKVNEKSIIFVSNSYLSYFYF